MLLRGQGGSHIGGLGGGGRGQCCGILDGMLCGGLIGLLCQGVGLGEGLGGAWPAAGGMCWGRIED